MNDADNPDLLALAGGGSLPPPEPIDPCTEERLMAFLDADESDPEVRGLAVPPVRSNRGGTLPFSREETARILIYLDAHQRQIPREVRLAILLMLDLFLRVQEIRCLTWGMFYFSKEWHTQVFIPGDLCKVVSPRRTQDRTLTISARTLRLLIAHWMTARRYDKAGAHRAVLFSPGSGDGLALKGHVIRRWIKKICAAALGSSFRRSCHSFRKTGGTELYEVSGSVYVAKQGLGHWSVASTENYIYIPDAHVNAQVARVRTGINLVEQTLREQAVVMARLSPAASPAELFADADDDDATLAAAAAQVAPQKSSVPAGMDERAVATAAALRRRQAERNRTARKSDQRRARERIGRCPGPPLADPGGGI